MTRDEKRTKEGQRVYYAKNRERIRAYGIKWGKENRDKRRGYSRKHTGLPLATRECPQLCEGCGSPPGKKALAVDHDHTTGAFRGWLCTRCNTGIGLLGDNVQGLFRALDYLMRNSK